VEFVNISVVISFIVCLDIKDLEYPSYCTMGNDIDCGEQKLANYSWLNNWRCYPKYFGSLIIIKYSNLLLYTLGI